LKEVESYHTSLERENKTKETKVLNSSVLVTRSGGLEVGNMCR
jgi:hypothetical protein